MIKMQVEKKYKLSGQIHVKAMELALSLCEPGRSLLEIAEKTENFIRKQGAIPAFPVNISINEIAAHYSPIIDDTSEILDNSIVKIDLGVAFDGFITDAARMKIFDPKFEKLKTSAEHALFAALKKINDKVNVYEVGAVVEKTIKKEGFKPITNLSGHSLGHYSLHDGLSVPNYGKNKKLWKPKDVFHKNNAYAIEPFSTTGKGIVIDDDLETIFIHYSRLRNTPSSQVREVFVYIKNNFYGLPFSPRWLVSKFSKRQIEKALEELTKQHVLHGYSVLKEITNKPVAQAEDTIFIKENGKKVILTRKKASDN